MIRMTSDISIALLLSLVLMTSCGGGGGGGGGTTSPPTFTKALITVGTAGSPSSSPIVGAQATVHLPAGISVRTMPNSIQTATGVVAAAGSIAPADLEFGIYSSGSTTMNVYVAKGVGFPSGNFATVSCNVAAGAVLSASAFTVSDLIVSDSTGSLITGLTPTIAVTFQ